MNRGIDGSNREAAGSIGGATRRRTEWLKIRNLAEFDCLLNRHPYMRTHPDFFRRYQRVVQFFQYRKLAIENPELSTAAAARLLGVPERTANYWKHEVYPILMRRLMTNERFLSSKEASMTSEYKVHYIPSYEVYDYFKTASSTDDTIERFSEIIEDIANTSQKQLCIVELKPYNKGHQEKMQRIARHISKVRNRIEEALENRFNSGNYIRIGVLDDKLFIWRQRTTKKHFLLLYDELFFFTKSTRKSLIRRTQQHLGGIGVVRLSELVRQMTGYTFSKRFPVDSINADLKHEKYYLSGRTLHFILDILNIDLDQCMQDVKRIGRGDQIRKPKILSNLEFDNLMTRLFAIIGSDGHIQLKLDRVQYSEWNDQRRERVIQLLKRLGDIEIKSRRSDEGKINRLILPPILGRILIKLGMPAGDKVLQGYNLPNFIMSGPFTNRCGYFEEVLPEEACISIRKDGKGYVILGRRSVLQDPAKSKVYSNISILTQNQIHLISKYGRKNTKSYGSKEVLEESIVLSRHRLRNLIEKPNKGRDANQFLEFIINHPPQLLIDERKLLSSIGIKTCLSWKLATLYESGRVSALWELRTKSQYDTALWGILSPPNDVVKMNKFQGWLKENKILVQQIQSAGLIPT